MITLFFSPIIGAVIGYFTNWLAIKMLFKPYKEMRIGSLKMPFTPGLIPKERYRLSKAVSNTIGEHLLTEDAVLESLCSDRVIDALKCALLKYFEGLKQSEDTLETLLERYFNLNRDDIEARFESFLRESIISNCKKAEQLAEDRLFHFSENATFADADQKTIGDFLTIYLQDKIDIIIEENTENINAFFLGILNNEQFDIIIKPIAVKIINSSLGGFIRMFVSSEKIYESAKKNFISYFSDTENISKTESVIKNLKTDLFSIKQKDVLLLLSREKSELIYNKFLSAIQELTKGETGDVMFKNFCQWFLDKALCLKLRIFVARLNDENFNVILDFVSCRYKEMVNNFLPGILNVLDLPQMIEERINCFEMDYAQNIIVGVVKKELNAITYLGGTLGFIIGFIPVLLHLFEIR